MCRGTINAKSKTTEKAKRMQKRLIWLATERYTMLISFGVSLADIVIVVL